MEQGSNVNIIAPFVMKTYEMVNDPSTDHLISWGRTNNTFLVVEPLHFSHLILPSYFNHNNFSSFVRQLNTYGFRKVDPDKWEFANQWFLRGQKHLLKNIARKKHSTTRPHRNHRDTEDHKLLVEIERIREEQTTLDEELKNMNRRLQTTERRPKQMKTFLCKVVEDPDIVTRVIMESDHGKYINSVGEGGVASPEKRRRLQIKSSSTSSSSIAQSNNSEEDEDTTLTAISPSNNLVFLNRLGSSHHKNNCMSVNSNLLPLGFVPNLEHLQMDMENSTYIEHYPNYMPLKEDSFDPTYPFSLLNGSFII